MKNMKLIMESFRKLLNEDIEDVLEPLYDAKRNFSDGDAGAVYQFEGALRDLQDYLQENYGEHKGYQNAVRQIETFKQMEKFDNNEAVEAQMNAIMDSIAFAKPSYG